MLQLIQDIPQHWKKTIVLLLSVSFLSFVIFYESWFSIVEIWYRSGTFTHGFVIIPISLWLVWTQKEDLLILRPEISWKVIAVILMSGFLWLLADLTHVQVIKQFATVALLVGGLWFVLGDEVTKKLSFPLFFLFLMVPAGEELVPYLMEFTAACTVLLIRLTGLTVYQEGLHFSLISGDWSVVEACSGINYLISSITLGIVYAYLTYQYTWKRCLFILLSMVVPIVANGGRAFLIVMIGHYSGMTLAVGVDHLIYGGVFFGLVMLILFYIGSFWRDEHEQINTHENISQSIVASGDETELKKSLYVLILTLGVTFSLWPASSMMFSNHQKVSTIGQNFRGLENNGWKKVADPQWNWKADFKNVEHDSIHYFSKQGNVVVIYQANFGQESQGGGEMVNSQNVVISRENTFWKIVGSGNLSITHKGGGSFVAEETTLRGNKSDLLLVSWYRVGEHYTSNNYVAKLLQLKNLLLLDASPEYINIVATLAVKNKEMLARERLLAFTEQWLESE